MSTSWRWAIAAAALRELPEALKAAREASRLSLWDVTKATGVSEMILSRLERREGYPSVPTVLKVMDWLATLGQSPTSDTQTDTGGERSA